MIVIAVILLTVLLVWGTMALGVKHHLDEMDEEPMEYDDAYNDWYAKQYGVEKWEEKK